MFQQIFHLTDFHVVVLLLSVLFFLTYTFQLPGSYGVFWWLFASLICSIPSCLYYIVG